VFYRHLGVKPYVIPLGGFSPLGTWGYIEAFRELLQQVAMAKLDYLYCIVLYGNGVL